MTKSIQSLIVASFVAFMSFSGSALADAPYKTIDVKTAKALPSDSLPEVLLFFMYTCPHCHTLEAHIDRAQWLTDKNAEHALIRLPVQFNGDSYVRLHYALVEMGIEEPLVSKSLFKLGNMQNHRKITLKKDNDFANYAAIEFSLPEADIVTAMKGFSVNMKTKQAMRHFIASGATGVPALTVKGKYLVDGATAGTQENMLITVQHLLGE